MEDQLLEQSHGASPASGSDTSTHPATAINAGPNDGEFPRLLQDMRNIRSWSKADLAKRASFDPSTITRLEQGSREPERETVLQLADAMALTAPDRDRLLAASGYRSETWDDPELVEIASLLADASVPHTVRAEIRAIVRAAISHGRLARAGVLSHPADG